MTDPEPLDPAQRSELARRIAEHEKDPSTAIPWEVALAQLRAKYGGPDGDRLVRRRPQP
jgi:putative addiction module component (TIGR02574 family)